MKSYKTIVLRFASLLTRLSFVGFIDPVWAQDADEVKAADTKKDTEITMRDGAKLFTSSYQPKDTAQKYPILLCRTPYSVSPYGADESKTSVGPSGLFSREMLLIVFLH